MIQAASALPLMIIVQLLHSHFVVDLYVGGQIVFLDRALLVGGLVLYAAWMLRSSKAPDRWVRCHGPLAALGMMAIFIEQRIIAIPIIWALQAAILVGLAAWAWKVWGCRVEQDKALQEAETAVDAMRATQLVREYQCQFVHLTTATTFHGFGTMMFYPVCQIGLGGLYIPPDNFRLACDTVIGPMLSAGLFASASVTWLTVLGVQAFMMRRKV